MQTETVKCPYCKTDCECDWVDIGVGLQQSGPYVCDKCFAIQISSQKSEDSEGLLSKKEIETGWYLPKYEEMVEGMMPEDIQRHKELYDV